MYESFAELWKKLCRGAMQLLHHLWTNTLVKSDIFDCRSNDNAAVAASDYIDSVAINDVAKEVLLLGNKRQHLSFNGARRNWNRRELGGPCARTVHNRFRKIASLRSD